MGLARTAGRKGRPWRRLRESVLSPVYGGSDVCLWCQHGGSRDVNHNRPVSRWPELRMTRSNLAPVHGVTAPCRHEACVRDGKPRVCNSEIGDRVPFVEIWPTDVRPAAGSRAW